MPVIPIMPRLAANNAAGARGAGRDCAADMRPGLASGVLVDIQGSAGGVFGVPHGATPVASHGLDAHSSALDVIHHALQLGYCGWMDADTYARARAHGSRLCAKRKKAQQNDEEDLHVEPPVEQMLVAY